MLVKMSHDEGKPMTKMVNRCRKPRVVLGRGREDGWVDADSSRKACARTQILSIALLCSNRSGVPSGALRLFVNSIEILAENLVHGEHMHAILFEHSS